MKTFHILGHNHKWNLDAFFENKIGDGFVFTAHSFGHDFPTKPRFSGHETGKILPLSMVDLQFYGKKESSKIENDNFASYPFHPTNHDGSNHTNLYLIDAIKEGIQFQENAGFKDIIIPQYFEVDNFERFLGILKTINRELIKKQGCRYLMNIPVGFEILQHDEKVDRLLFVLTEDSIQFDGYFIALEQRHDYKQKLTLNLRYLSNTTRILTTLKRQQFTTALAYANWDALIYLSLVEIDIVTIGSYENLRNFTIERYTSPSEGGPSKGWYFSAPLLNFVKSQFLDVVRAKKCIDLIKNDKNIFSDIVLEENFPWNMHKPDVHKNYLLCIDRLLKELAGIKDLNARKQAMLTKIKAASGLYQDLHTQKVALSEESSNYHLGTWETFLLSR